MRVASIKGFDIINGDGIRVSLWVQGCNHKCKGCHNKHTWSFKGGKQWDNDELVDELYSKITEYEGFTKNLSILGGEPLDPINVPDLTYVVSELKKRLPRLNIWLWTGYTFDKIKELDVISLLDVVIDGKYDESLKDENLVHYGSSNQNLINLK